MDELKQKAAMAALDFVDDDMIVGVGTGSTVNYFIEALKTIKHRIDACVASSVQTEQLLKEAGIPQIDLNVAVDIPLYVDGADEVDSHHRMIKGGGGALTREKIVASCAKTFVCIVDETKVKKNIGTFPVAIEVIPMARSYVGRQIVHIGGDPVYRDGFTTDNGNIILDAYDMDMTDPKKLETTINAIPGVVDNGLFTYRLADKVIIGQSDGVTIY